MNLSNLLEFEVGFRRMIFLVDIKNSITSHFHRSTPFRGDGGFLPVRRFKMWPMRKTTDSPSQPQPLPIISIGGDRVGGGRTGRAMRRGGVVNCGRLILMGMAGWRAINRMRWRGPPAIVVFRPTHGRSPPVSTFVITPLLILTGGNPSRAADGIFRLWVPLPSPARLPGSYSPARVVSVWMPRVRFCV